MYDTVPARQETIYEHYDFISMCEFMHNIFCYIYNKMMLDLHAPSFGVHSQDTKELIKSFTNIYRTI